MKIGAAPELRLHPEIAGNSHFLPRPRTLPNVRGRGRSIGDPKGALVDEIMRGLLEMTSHNAHPTAPAVAEAHRTMRVHRGCGIDHCGRKRQALRVLIAAGRIVPDSARLR
ncbi:hypothetical protein AB0H71_09900 [Nocardia sp. NPDC050697]|uniref:hypothetical protein n=1 Tax=Nocardia sp. NPDC050697 TaxID=3155158 RepID=UPI0033D05AA1